MTTRDELQDKFNKRIVVLLEKISERLDYMQSEIDNLNREPETKDN